MAGLQHRPSRWLASGLIAALLFMQLAASAHACPVSTARARATSHPPGCAMAHAPDPQPTQLCKAHCEQGSQALNAIHAADAPATPLLLVILDWSPSVLAPVRVRGRLLVAPSGAPPPGSPPLYLSLLVLRN